MSNKIEIRLNASAAEMADDFMESFNSQKPIDVAGKKYNCVGYVDRIDFWFGGIPSEITFMLERVE